MDVVINVIDIADDVVIDVGRGGSLSGSAAALLMSASKNAYIYPIACGRSLPYQARQRFIAMTAFPGP
jgi:hypothetical protein